MRVKGIVTAVYSNRDILPKQNYGSIRSVTIFAIPFTN